MNWEFAKSTKNMIKCYRNCEFVKHRECKAPFVVLFDKGDCNREQIGKHLAAGSYKPLGANWICKEKCKYSLKVKYFDGFVRYCSLDEITIGGDGTCEQLEKTDD